MKIDKWTKLFIFVLTNLTILYKFPFFLFCRMFKREMQCLLLSKSSYQGNTRKGGCMGGAVD